MRTWWRILLAIILLLWSCLPLWAATPEERIERVCRDYVLSQLQWEPDDVEIRFRRYIKPALDWSKVSLRVSHPRNADFCGVITLRVAAVKGGNAIRSFPVPIEITLYNEVVVITRKLRRHAVISADDFTLERRKVNLSRNSPVTDPAEVIGRRTVRVLSVGRPVVISMIEEIPVIERGQKVTVRYRSGNLLLTTLGEAIEDGWAGGLVRVKNLASKKLITVMVADAGIVDILRPNPGN